MHPQRMVGALHMQAFARARPLMLGLHAQAVAKACEFLLGVQRPDGGWGESYLSCQDKVHPPAISQVVIAKGRCMPAMSYLSCQDKVHPPAIFSDPLSCPCTWLVLASRALKW